MPLTGPKRGSFVCALCVQDGFLLIACNAAYGSEAVKAQALRMLARTVQSMPLSPAHRKAIGKRGARNFLEPCVASLVGKVGVQPPAACSSRLTRMHAQKRPYTHDAVLSLRCLAASLQFTHIYLLDKYVDCNCAHATS